MWDILSGFILSKFFGSRNLTSETHEVKNFKGLQRANKSTLNLRRKEVNSTFIKAQILPINCRLFGHDAHKEKRAKTYMGL